MRRRSPPRAAGRGSGRARRGRSPACRWRSRARRSISYSVPSIVTVKPPSMASVATSMPSASIVVLSNASARPCGQHPARAVEERAAVALAGDEHALAVAGLHLGGRERRAGHDALDPAGRRVVDERAHPRRRLRENEVVAHGYLLNCLMMRRPLAMRAVCDLGGDRVGGDRVGREVVDVPAGRLQAHRLDLVGVGAGAGVVVDELALLAEGELGCAAQHPIGDAPVHVVIGAVAGVPLRGPVDRGEPGNQHRRAVGDRDGKAGDVVPGVLVGQRQERGPVRRRDVGDRVERDRAGHHHPVGEVQRPR